MTTWPFHSASELFPLLEGARFAELVADIKAHGLQEPIVLHNGAILDGRNRYRACREAGVEVRTVEPKIDDPIRFVVSANLQRRHLSESDRALIAAKIANMKAGMRTDRQPPPDLGEVRPISVPEAAKLMNVGRGTVEAARTVLRDGTAEDKAEVQAGKTGVTTVERRIRERHNDMKHPGNRAKVPHGLTLEEATRHGLAAEAQGTASEQAADAAGLARQTYLATRRIVALADRDDLSPSEMEKVRNALARVNETRRVKEAAAAVAPIVERVWGKKANFGLAKTEERRMKRFERAYSHVVDACAQADYIEVPHLGTAQANAIAGEIRKAGEALSRLRRRIMEQANA